MTPLPIKELGRQPITETVMHVDLESLGAEGLQGDFIVAWVDKSGKAIGELIGSPGIYRVTFTLARSDSNAEKLEIGPHESLDGDSHVLFNAEPHGAWLKVSFTTPDGVTRKATLEPNPKGRLSKLHMDIDAQAFQDAQAKAMAWVGPFLSLMSFQNDVPIHVAQIDTLESATLTRTMRTSLPFRDKPLLTAMTSTAGEYVYSPDLRGLYSLYREHLNTSNPFYKFLCLYKILEGLEKVRPRAAGAAKKCGLQIKRPREVLGDSDYLVSRYPRYVNRHVDEFYREVLNQKFRDTLAHFNLEFVNESAKLSPSPDNLMDVREYVELLPVVKQIVRTKLQNELSFRAALSEHCKGMGITYPL